MNDGLCQISCKVKRCYSLQYYLITKAKDGPHTTYSGGAGNYFTNAVKSS